MKRPIVGALGAFSLLFGGSGQAAQPEQMHTSSPRFPGNRGELKPRPSVEKRKARKAQRVESILSERDRLRDAEAIERLIARRTQQVQRGRGALRANRKYLRSLQLDADALRNPEAFDRGIAA